MIDRADVQLVKADSFRRGGCLYDGRNELIVYSIPMESTGANGVTWIG